FRSCGPRAHHCLHTECAAAERLRRTRPFRSAELKSRAAPAADHSRVDSGVSDPGSAPGHVRLGYWNECVRAEDGIRSISSHGGLRARRAKHYRVAFHNISYRHFPGCIEHRISNRANVGVDALKVAQDIEM